MTAVHFVFRHVLFIGCNFTNSDVSNSVYPPFQLVYFKAVASSLQANHNKHGSDLLEDLDEIQSLGRSTVAPCKTHREAPEIMNERKESSQ